MTFALSSILHSGYSHRVLRHWQATHARHLCKEALMYPVFICDSPDAIEEIGAMPGQKRWISLIFILFRVSYTFYCVF